LLGNIEIFNFNGSLHDFLFRETSLQFEIFIQ
jgi:hypothetical protein